MKPNWADFNWARRISLLVLAGLGLGQFLYAAEPQVPLSQMDPKKAGQLLAERLRAGAPSESTSLKGKLKIRRRGSPFLEIPFRFEARPGQTNWQAIYETASVGNVVAEKLTIIHAGEAPNEYLFARASKPGEAPETPARLTNDEAAISLGNSDFWLTDLGLEFAHWPSQRYVKGEMRKSRYCYVLESTNRHPSDKGYSRVLSWIDQESGGIILAEAYDRAGNLLKDFSLLSVKKVEGQWQLQEIEIINDQTHSRTRLEFDYEKK